MLSQMVEQFNKWSPAVFVGYNSISFDEEFLRKSLFKTLNEPYLTQYSGNKRGDILGLIRTAHLYYPDCIKTPMSDKGNAVFKLAELTEMNGSQINATAAALSYLGYKSASKLAVVDVNKDGKAQDVILINDQVLTINDRKFENTTELLQFLDSKKPGEFVTVKVNRQGVGELTKKIALSARFIKRMLLRYPSGLIIPKFLWIRD